jgi:hypothetical protein
VAVKEILDTVLALPPTQVEYFIQAPNPDKLARKIREAIKHAEHVKLTNYANLLDQFIFRVTPSGVRVQRRVPFVLTSIEDKQANLQTQVLQTPIVPETFTKVNSLIEIITFLVSNPDSPRVKFQYDGVSMEDINKISKWGEAKGYIVIYENNPDTLTFIKK